MSATARLPYDGARVCAHKMRRAFQGRGAPGGGKGAAGRGGEEESGGTHLRSVPSQRSGVALHRGAATSRGEVKRTTSPTIPVVVGAQDGRGAPLPPPPSLSVSAPLGRYVRGDRLVGFTVRLPSTRFNAEETVRVLKYDATHVSAQGAGRPYCVLYLDGPERGCVMWELESEFDRAHVVNGTHTTAPRPTREAGPGHGSAPVDPDDGDEGTHAVRAPRDAAPPLALEAALAHRSKRPRRRSASAAPGPGSQLSKLGRGGDVTMRSFRALWDAMSWETKSPYFFPTDTDSGGAKIEGDAGDGPGGVGRDGTSAGSEGRGRGDAMKEPARAPPRRSPRITCSLASAAPAPGERGDTWHRDIAPALVELQDKNRVISSLRASAVSAKSRGRRMRRGAGCSPAAAPPVHQLIPMCPNAQPQRWGRHLLSPPPPPPLEPPPHAARAPRPVNASSLPLLVQHSGSLAIMPQNTSLRERTLAEGWLLYLSDGGPVAGGGPGPGAATGAYCLDASPYYTDGLVFRRVSVPSGSGGDGGDPGAGDGAPPPRVAHAFMWYGDEGRWFVRANPFPRLVSSSDTGATTAVPPTAGIHRVGLGPAWLQHDLAPSRGATYLLRSQPGCGARPPVGLRWWRRDAVSGAHTEARDICVEVRVCVMYRYILCESRPAHDYILTCPPSYKSFKNRDIWYKVLPRTFASPASVASTLSTLYRELHIARVPSLSTLRARGRARRAHAVRAERAQKRRRKLQRKLQAKMLRAARVAAGGRKRKRKQRAAEEKRTAKKAKKARVPRLPKAKKKKKVKVPHVRRAKKPRVKKGPVSLELNLTVTFCANPANDLTCPPSYI